MISVPPTVSRDHKLNSTVCVDTSPVAYYICKQGIWNNANKETSMAQDHGEVINAEWLGEDENGQGQFLTTYEDGHQEQEAE